MIAIDNTDPDIIYIQDILSWRGHRKSDPEIGLTREEAEEVVALLSHWLQDTDDATT